MKPSKFLMALATLLVAATAQGQILSPTAGAAAGAAAGSQSQAGAVSGAGAAAVLIQEVEAPVIPSTTTQNQNVHHSGTYTLKNAPQVIAPNILPTVPCASVTSGGISVVGAGVSFGTAHQDEDCNLRETARLFHAVGMVSDALDVICMSKHAAAAKACKQRVEAQKSAERAEEDQRAAADLRRKQLDTEKLDFDRRNTRSDAGLFKPVMLSADDAALMKLRPTFCDDTIIASRNTAQCVVERQ